MTGTVAAPATIDSLSTFLKYGPTGLAGLLLILVVIALNLRTITESRERLLKHFMYIGTACFALALAANFFSVAGAYPLYFRVIPLDAGSKQILPMPIIKANNKLVDKDMTYLVKSEVTAIVDVTDAINFAQEIRQQNDRQRQTLNTMVSSSDSLVSDLQKVPQILDRNCSGGSSGIPAASNPAVIAITSKAASVISGYKASANAVIAAPPPEFKYR